jgi:hypothetical protein
MTRLRGGRGNRRSGNAGLAREFFPVTERRY